MPSEESTPIILRDLQSLLRGSIGKDVIVVEYETSNLLGMGENYGSTVLKVDVVIKRDEDAKEERLNLVAKMMPRAELKSTMKATEVFAKEIFVFEKLAPAYRRLELEAGVKAEHLIDELPKFYGGRLTRNPESPCRADEDAVILMENVKVLGYYTGNRFLGLDFEHAKFAITELARFHALGIATRCKNPAFFEEVKKIISPFPFEMTDVEFSSINDNTFKTICGDPRIARYEDRLKACLDKNREWESLLNLELVEPWVGISHGDFWVNNMLFHQSDGKLDDVKFVDFQLSRISSPLRDLPFFLCSSVNAEVLDQHVDDLLDIYYVKFIEVLGSIGCDTSPFTRASFDERLRKDSNASFYPILIAVKFATLEVNEDQDVNDIKSSIMLSGGSNKYLERAWRIVSKFVEKGWL